MWRRPKNQNTNVAATAKRQITEFGALWSSMSASLQADWTSFGASPPELDYNSLGIQYWLTGFQWLVRANVRRGLVTLTPTTTVPTNSAVTAPATCTITADAGPPLSVIVEWSQGDFPSYHSALIYLATYPSTGLQNFPGKGILVYTAYQPAGTSREIGVYATNRFGTIQPGSSIFCKLYSCRNDGVRSIATPAQCRVT
jgi:hypothetical protein